MQPWVVTVATAVLALAVIGGVVTWRLGSDQAPGTAGSVSAPTATVTRTRLSTTQSLTGTLGYGSAQSLTGRKSGTVTWLPASGAQVARGEPMYKVDNGPVALFYGSTPLYRTLNAVGMVGPDVRMIVQNLTALGYDTGYQPPAGTVVTQEAATSPSSAAAPLSISARQAAPTQSPPQSPIQSPSQTPAQSPTRSPTQAPAQSPAPTTPAAPRTPVTATVRPGDAVLTTALRAAITRWQKTVGLPATGVLGVGDVLVEPGPVKILALQAQLGGDGAGPLMTVASTAKTVVVTVDATDVVTVRQSAHVTITLPDGTKTRGTIIAIGTSVQSGTASSDGQPQQTVTVAPADAAAVASLTSAQVQVSFVGQTVAGVLAVPVTALLALSGGGYALQLPGGRLIPVTTGMFAQGLVQVTGPGLTPGMRVVNSG